MGILSRFSQAVTVTDWLGNKLTDAQIEEMKEKMDRAAIKNMALRTAVGLIADLISGCEIQVFEDGKEVRNHRWYLLNISANPNATAAKEIAKWIIRMYYDGEAIMFPLSNSLFVADSFSVERNATRGDLYSGIVVDELAVKRTYRADKLMVLRQNNPEIKKLVASVYDGYSELLEYSLKAYKQGAGEKYWFNIGNRPSGNTDEEKQYMELIENRLKGFVEAESGIIPLHRDQSIQRISSATGSSGSALDYPEIRKEVYAIVAEVLHLPGGLLEGNITSVDQTVGQALTFAIDPLVHMMDEELTRKNYSEDDITRRGAHIRIDTTSIKHIDVLDAAANIDKLIASGFMSIDEVRHRCDMAELGEDWSKKHYITKNYGDIADTTTAKGGDKR